MNKHKQAPALTFGQNGAVSMITVLFVVVILTVLVISFVRIMIYEQRQSTDDDLSNRAFYAAESGIEDAKAFLAEYVEDLSAAPSEQLDKFESCESLGDNELIADDSLKTEITCQTVDTVLPDLLADSATPWHSFVVPLRSDEIFYGFTLEWHKPGVDGQPYTLKNNNRLPTTANWQNGSTPYPAGLKATLIASDSSDSREEAINSTRVTHMVPRSSGSSGPFNVQSTSFGFGDDSPLGVGCNAAAGTDDYACSARFMGLDTDLDYYLVLTPLYKSTSIRLTLQGSNSNVDLVDTQAEVDVTARAGDVFRRTRARILLTDPAASLIPDLTVGSNEICKDYALRESSDEFDDANRPGITDTYCMYDPS